MRYFYVQMAGYGIFTRVGFRFFVNKLFGAERALLYFMLQTRNCSRGGPLSAKKKKETGNFGTYILSTARKTTAPENKQPQTFTPSAQHIV